MTTFVNDTFTDTAAVGLASHTPEVGGAVTEHASMTSGSGVISDANRFRGASANSTCYHYAGTPASADYYVEAVVRRLSDLGSVGVAGRVDTGANTMYYARYNAPTSDWELMLFDAGASSTLGAFDQTLVDGNDYTVRLEMIGSAIKVYVDSVERISVADSVISAAGKAGVRSATSVGNTTGYHLDSITAADIGGADRRMLLGVG